MLGGVDMASACQFAFHNDAFWRHAESYCCPRGPVIVTQHNEWIRKNWGCSISPKVTKPQHQKSNCINYINETVINSWWSWTSSVFLQRIQHLLGFSFSSICVFEFELNQSNRMQRAWAQTSKEVSDSPSLDRYHIVQPTRSQIWDSRYLKILYADLWSMSYDCWSAAFPGFFSYIRETLINFEVPIPVHLVSPKRVPEPTTARGTQTWDSYDADKLDRNGHDWWCVMVLWRS